MKCAWTKFVFHREVKACVNLQILNCWSAPPPHPTPPLSLPYHVDGFEEESWFCNGQYSGCQSKVRMNYKVKRCAKGNCSDWNYGFSPSEFAKIFDFLSQTGRHFMHNPLFYHSGTRIHMCASRLQRRRRTPIQRQLAWREENGKLRFLNIPPFSPNRGSPLYCGILFKKLVSCLLYGLSSALPYPHSTAVMQ